MKQVALVANNGAITHEALNNAGIPAPLLYEVLSSVTSQAIAPILQMVPVGFGVAFVSTDDGVDITGVQRDADIRQILTIVADCNDGDYLTEETDITGWTEEQVDQITRVAAAVSKCEERHNWPTSEYTSESIFDLYEDLPQDDVATFCEMVPCGEYGVHTITSIEIRNVSVAQKLV